LLLLLLLLVFSSRHVPADERHQTPVRLMATAGLRLLPPQQAEAILEACRARLTASHFVFQREWVEVIGGKDEGLYAWTAANYAAGVLQVMRGGLGIGRLLGGLRGWAW
jgi:Golgi nucleoside diphosphatase